MSTTLLVSLALGLVIGALLGLLGGGGSILAVPALVYGVGQPLSVAVPTSLLVVGISSATAVLPRLRQVQWRLALIFGATGAVAAFAGTAVNRLLDPSMVLLGFAAVMVIAAVRMLRSFDDVGGSCALPGGGVNWRSCLPKAAASGVVVGFLTGLFGVGGGFLIIPALTLLLGLPMATATATSLVVIVINSAAGFTAHLGDASLDLATAIAFTGAAVLSSLAAGRLAPRLPGQKLRRWFAYLVLAVAAYVAIQATLSLIH
ncbi:MAG TPA: sulfite exporter TauE/SafE family protein [Propionibacteriaceae bacterium]